MSFEGYRVIRSHHDRQPCPRCRRNEFCDGCALCKACKFMPPDVNLPHPPAPLPKLRCPECGETAAHARTCSVTLRAAAS